MNQLFENKKSSLEKSNLSSKKSLNSASYAFNGLYQLQELANQKSESTTQLKADSSSNVQKLSSFSEMASNKSDSNFQNLNSVAQLFSFRKKAPKIHINLEEETYENAAKTVKRNTAIEKREDPNGALNNAAKGIGEGGAELLGGGDNVGLEQLIKEVDPSAGDSGGSTLEDTGWGTTYYGTGGLQPAAGDSAATASSAGDSAAGDSAATASSAGDSGGSTLEDATWGTTYYGTGGSAPAAEDTGTGGATADDIGLGADPTIFDAIGQEIQDLVQDIGESIEGAIEISVETISTNFQNYMDLMQSTGLTPGGNEEDDANLVVDSSDPLSFILTAIQSSEKTAKILQPIAQFTEDCWRGRLSKTVLKDVFYKALRTLEGVSKAVEAGAELANTSDFLFGGEQGVVESGESTSSVADLSGSLGSSFSALRGFMNLYEEHRKLSEEEDGELDSERKREIIYKRRELSAKILADAPDIYVKAYKAHHSLSNITPDDNSWIPLVGSATGIFRGMIDLFVNIPKWREYNNQLDNISQQINDLNERWVQTGAEKKGMQFGKDPKYTLENYKEIRRINIANKANIAKVEKEHALTNRVNLDPNLSAEALQEEILRKKEEAEQNKTWRKKSFFSRGSKAKDIKRDLSGDEGRKAELAEALQKKKDSVTKKLSDKQQQLLDQNGNFVMKSPEDPHGIQTLTEKYDGETKKEIRPDSDQHGNPLSQEQEEIIRDYEIYSELKRVNKLNRTSININFIESGSKILGNILTLIPEATTQGIGAGIKAAGVVTKYGYQAGAKAVDSGRDIAAQAGKAGDLARKAGLDPSKSSTAREAWRKEQVQNTLNKTHEIGEKINLQDEGARKLISKLIEKNKKIKQLANLPETNLNYINEFNEERFFDKETAGELNNYAALLNIYKIKESELKDIDEVGFYAKIIKGLSVK